jgi:hypothetical protein
MSDGQEEYREIEQSMDDELNIQSQGRKQQEDGESDLDSDL